jgi:hypothetical protein
VIRCCFFFLERRCAAWNGNKSSQCCPSFGNNLLPCVCLLLQVLGLFWCCQVSFSVLYFSLDRKCVLPCYGMQLMSWFSWLHVSLSQGNKTFHICLMPQILERKLVLLSLMLLPGLERNTRKRVTLVRRIACLLAWKVSMRSMLSSCCFRKYMSRRCC